MIAHCEMPLSPMDVNAYKLLTDAGVIVCPANPGFYLNPTTVGEVVDFPRVKTITQKFRRRKNYRRLKGHTQPHIKLRITSITG